MRKIKNIIFDLDGTLWDSRKQIIKAWNQIFIKRLGHVINKSDLTVLMGKTRDEFIDKLFSDINENTALEIMTQCEQNELKVLAKKGGKLYPHTISTLKQLHNKYNLFIVSNCQNGYIETFLNIYGLNNYFKDYECCGNTGENKKHNIRELMIRNNLKNNNTCYIGDTYDDYLSTLSNNLIFIYAKYGFGKCNEAKYVLKNIKNIDEIIKEIENL